MLDALPIDQFQLTEQGWREVLVANNSDDTDALKFVLSSTPTKREKLLPFLQDRQQEYSVGDVIEVNSEASFLIRSIGEEIQRFGKGLALVVDYGYDKDSRRRRSTFRVRL